MVSPLRIPRMNIITTIDTIKSASWVDIVHIDQTLDREAWTLLKERKDKNWSLVDCTSFVVMRQSDIVKAFTADHHFEQEGFVRVLK